jgi:LysR family hydrogen peroxide-inducible transcriptional activator
VPRREIATYWRETSAYREFLPQIAEVMRDLPPGLVDTAPLP